MATAAYADWAPSTMSASTSTSFSSAPHHYGLRDPLPTWGTLALPSAYGAGTSTGAYAYPMGTYSASETGSVFGAPTLHGHSSSARPTSSKAQPFTLSVIPHTHAAAPGGSILDSTLVGPDGQPRFYVDSASTSGASGANAAGRTVVESAHSGRVGVVTWGRPGPGLGAGPSVHINELGWTMRTGEWLYLSSNRACRTMIANGRQFSWRPSTSGGHIELYMLDTPDDAGPVARISCSTPQVNDLSGSICTIQLMPKALQLGLLNVVVVSAVLLLSGRSID